MRGEGWILARIADRVKWEWVRETFWINLKKPVDTGEVAYILNAPVRSVV